jgi:hypothetical protein
MQGTEKGSSKIHGIEILEHTDIPLCSAHLHLEKDILNPGEIFHPKLINSVPKFILTKHAYPTKYRDVEISEQSSRVLN